MIRIDQSGAAENQGSCRIAPKAISRTAVQRAIVMPASSPAPVNSTTTPRVRLIQPQVVMSATITPWPPTMTISLLRIAASPQKASSPPITSSITPAKIAHPWAWALAWVRPGASARGSIVLIGRTPLCCWPPPDATFWWVGGESPGSGDTALAAGLDRLVAGADPALLVERGDVGVLRGLR